MNSPDDISPSIRSAQQILGFKSEEIARAVRADPEILKDWEQGQATKALQDVQLKRLRCLDETAREVARTLRSEVVPEWMARRIPAFGHRTPREVILSGRSDVVLSALRSFNQGNIL